MVGGLNKKRTRISGENQSRRFKRRDKREESENLTYRTILPQRAFPFAASKGVMYRLQELAPIEKKHKTTTALRVFRILVDSDGNAAP